MKCLGLFFLIACIVSIHHFAAAGTYYIGKDDQGVYLYTSEHGYWRFDPKHAQRLTIGAEGMYSVVTSQSEVYIRTDRFGDFSVDPEQYEQTRRAIRNYNQEQRQATINETKVIIKGNQVLVPVMIGYGTAETEALLLLDTGASGTLLHREIANALSIREIGQTEIMVVGGKKIPTGVAKLSYIQVGPHKKQGVCAGIIDQKGSAVVHQGLLGMDILGGLKFQVDFERQVISWK